MLYPFFIFLSLVRPVYCLSNLMVSIDNNSDSLFIDEHNFIMYQFVFFGLLAIFISGLLLRSVLVPSLKVSEKTWACLVLSLYANLSFYILLYKIQNFSLYLVGLVCVFIAFVSCIFLLYFSWREHQNQDSFQFQFKHYYLNLYNSLDYVNLKEFWTVDFPKRKPRPLLYAVWEYPILVLASFYTLARTRLALFQTLFVIRASLLFLFGQFHLLLIYMLPLYVLTALFSVEFVKEYFDEVYGSNSVKKIGWNGWWTAVAQITPTMGRTILAGAVSAGFVTVGSEISGPAYRARLVESEYSIDKLVEKNGGIIDPLKTAARVEAIRNSDRTILKDCIVRVHEINRAISGFDNEK